MNNNQEKVYVIYKRHPSKLGETLINILEIKEEKPQDNQSYIATTKENANKIKNISILTEGTFFKTI